MGWANFVLLFFAPPVIQEVDSGGNEKFQKRMRLRISAGIDGGAWPQKNCSPQMFFS